MKETQRTTNFANRTSQRASNTQFTVRMLTVISANVVGICGATGNSHAYQMYSYRKGQAFVLRAVKKYGGAKL
jgi:hypothetical protein